MRPAWNTAWTSIRRWMSRASLSKRFSFSKGMNVFETNPHVIEKLKELGVLLFTERSNTPTPTAGAARSPSYSGQRSNGSSRWTRRASAASPRRGGQGHMDTRMGQGPDLQHALRRGPTGASPVSGSWGVPITIFYCDKCREPYWSEESFDSVVSEGQRSMGPTSGLRRSRPISCLRTHSAQCGGRTL